MCNVLESSQKLISQPEIHSILHISITKEQEHYGGKGRFSSEMFCSHFSTDILRGLMYLPSYWSVGLCSGSPDHWIGVCLSLALQISSHTPISVYISSHTDSLGHASICTPIPGPPIIWRASSDRHALPFSPAPMQSLAHSA